MEKIKYYCDRCEAEITKKKLTMLESVWNLSYVDKYTFFNMRTTRLGKSKFELCRKCYTSFIDWCEDTIK